MEFTQQTLGGLWDLMMNHLSFFISASSIILIKKMFIAVPASFFSVINWFFSFKVNSLEMKPLLLNYDFIVFQSLYCWIDLLHLVKKSIQLYFCEVD